MQVTIARQLGLDPSTVSNFFMNARRRSVDKWREDSPHNGSNVNVPQGSVARTVLVTTAGGPATVVQHLGQGADLSPSSLSSAQLDLWHDLSVGGSSPGPSHTVYIIPRDRLVAAANGTFTVASGGASSHLTVTDDSEYDSDQVILENHEEILETEEEVLDDDDCLDPPD